MSNGGGFTGEGGGDGGGGGGARECRKTREINECGGRGDDTGSGADWLKAMLAKLPVPSFYSILAWRLVNALTINTFFQADEYWQSLEPAHRIVYGYGYLTWEWELGLRSYLHPLLYILPYAVANLLNLDYGYVIAGPKIMNALIASVGDYYLFYLVDAKFQNLALSKLVCYLSLFSAWNWYCWCRSFANSLELTLTIVALFKLQSNKIVTSIIIAALTCLIRPTNAIIWLFYYPRMYLKAPKYIWTSMIVAITVLFLDAVLNHAFYASWKIPLLNFFKFNVYDSLSSFYGISRMDFYIFQAIPILLLNYLPFFVYGIIYSTSKFTSLKVLLMAYIFLFTMIPHKEFRFIYPLMPVLLIFSANGFLQISSKVSVLATKLIFLVTLVLSVVISIYFTQYHEVGELAIPKIIRDHVLDDYSQLENIVEVGFLTPCHSTPFQSHFHLPESQANIWFLTCEPPLQKNLHDEMTVDSYLDESDYFYKNPSEFLKSNFPSDINPRLEPPSNTAWPHRWPQYLVMFETLWEEDGELRSYIENNYIIVESIWNTPGHWDSRREGNILLLKYV